MAQAMLSKPKMSGIFLNRSLPLPHRATAAELLDRGFTFLSAKNRDQWTQEQIRNFFDGVDRFNRCPNVIEPYNDVYDWLALGVLKKDPKEVRTFAEKIYNARKGKHIQIHATSRQCWDNDKKKIAPTDKESTDSLYTANRQCVSTAHGIECSDSNSETDYSTTDDSTIDDMELYEADMELYEADFV